MSSHIPQHLFFAHSLPDLLLRYQSGDSAFVSPRQAVLAAGVALQRQMTGLDQVPDMAIQLLQEARQQGWSRALLMGAIPFHPQASARLFVPRYVEVLPRLESLTATTETATTRRTVRMDRTRMQPTPHQYKQLVKKAVSQIRKGDFEKVVLSRSVHLQAEVDLPALLSTLAQRNPLGYTFALNLGEDDAQARSLVGASPELLLSKCGNRVLSNPLAGSVARSQDAEENRRRADVLLQSQKDRHEHALVVDAVAAALRPFCRTLEVPAVPSVLATPTMLHLSSEIRGELIDPALSSLELALALHPTPAVCGFPPQPALDFIQHNEGFDRGLFTGLVGWSGANGDGEWAVTIRCAEVTADGVTLYAGAGVVEGSDPVLELAETTAKMRTMLSALGLELGLESVLGALA